MLQTTTLGASAASGELRLLRFLVFALFIGRAYQAVFWDISLRALLWDERWAGGAVWLLTGLTWEEYATDIRFDILYQRIAEGIGLFWAFCAVLSLGLRADQRWARRLLRIGTGLLFFLHFLDWKDKFFWWAQLMEHAAQALAPLFLIYAVRRQQPLNSRFLWALKITLSFTFFCHGLFAYGYYPVPAPWQEWCIAVFHFPDAASAKFFLWIMGILDFVAAIGLLFRPTFALSVWYCIVWGTMTALARVWANVFWDSLGAGLHQWWFETAYRLVHGGLPLLLWLWERRFRSQTRTAPSESDARTNEDTPFASPL